MCVTIDDIDSKQPFLYEIFWMFTLPSEKGSKNLSKVMQREPCQKERS